MTDFKAQGATASNGTPKDYQPVAIDEKQPFASFWTATSGKPVSDKAFAELQDLPARLQAFLKSGQQLQDFVMNHGLLSMFASLNLDTTALLADLKNYTDNPALLQKAIHVEHNTDGTVSIEINLPAGPIGKLLASIITQMRAGTLRIDHTQAKNAVTDLMAELGLLQGDELLGANWQLAPSEKQIDHVATVLQEIFEAAGRSVDKEKLKEKYGTIVTDITATATMNMVWFGQTYVGIDSNGVSVNNADNPKALELAADTLLAKYGNKTVLAITIKESGDPAKDRATFMAYYDAMKNRGLTIDTASIEKYEAFKQELKAAAAGYTDKMDKEIKGALAAPMPKLEASA